jgi:hypothetical protein
MKVRSVYEGSFTRIMRDSQLGYWEVPDTQYCHNGYVTVIRCSLSTVAVTTPIL